MPTNLTYKQYTNTLQSIYANIKDAFRVLREKLVNVTGSKTIHNIVYSEADRETLLSTARYNGSCVYLGNVAKRLQNIDAYFPGETTSDIADLKEKMRLMGASSTICAQLYSPGDLSIQDGKGNTVGVVNGEEKNDFPMAVHDQREKFVKLYFADEENYIYVVDGTGTGTYGLKITILNKYSKPVEFFAKDVPLSSEETHTYEFNREASLRGDVEVVVGVDKGKDGTVDSSFVVGSVLNDRSLFKKE